MDGIPLLESFSYIDQLDSETCIQQYIWRKTHLEKNLREECLLVWTNPHNAMWFSVKIGFLNGFFTFLKT